MARGRVAATILALEMLVLAVTGAPHVQQLPWISPLHLYAPHSVYPLPRVTGKSEDGFFEVCGLSTTNFSKQTHISLVLGAQHGVHHIPQFPNVYTASSGDHLQVFQASIQPARTPLLETAIQSNSPPQLPDQWAEELINSTGMYKSEQERSAY
jgi:hypothetical protein